jgi:hypothetical protein
MSWLWFVEFVSVVAIPLFSYLNIDAGLKP